MNSKIILAICLSTIIFFDSPCHPQDAKGQSETVSLMMKSSVSGQYFLKLDENDKALYTSGLVDGILIAPLFSYTLHRRIWFEECVQNMKHEQIIAILEKYLTEHPEKWHRDMPTIAFIAFKEACPEAKKYFDKKRPKN